jgi:hypothetical protein
MQLPFGMFTESQLAQPLVPSPNDSIKSWEVWKAVAQVLRPQDEPSLELHLQELQRVYTVAQAQFHQTLETNNIVS